MNQRTYNLVSAFFFGAICLLHLYRAVTWSTLIVAGADVPMWASWVAIVVTGFLTFSAVKLSKA